MVAADYVQVWPLPPDTTTNQSIGSNTGEMHMVQETSHRIILHRAPYKKRPLRGTAKET